MALIFNPPLDFETPMKVEDRPLTMLLAEKTKHAWQAQHDFRTGFLTDSEGDRPAWLGHQETVRFPGDPPPTPTQRPGALRINDRASRFMISRPSQ